MQTTFKHATKRLRTIVAVAMVAQLLTATSSLGADEGRVVEHPPVGLILLDSLMSGRSQVGDVVHFETLANVTNGHGDILVPAGCLAFGHVTRSKGSGMFGKRGQLEFTCEYVELPYGGHVPLTGAQLGAAGANGTAATVAVTVLVSPLGLLIKGGSSKVEKGTPVEMFIADGSKVTPTSRASTPLKADFTLRDKSAPDCIGTVTGYDGAAYTVQSGARKRKVLVTDIASISLVFAPAGER